MLQIVLDTHSRQFWAHGRHVKEVVR